MSGPEAKSCAADAAAVPCDSKAHSWETSGGGCPQAVADIIPEANADGAVLEALAADALANCRSRNCLITDSVCLAWTIGGSSCACAALELVRPLIHTVFEDSDASGHASFDV